MPDPEQESPLTPLDETPAGSSPQESRPTDVPENPKVEAIPGSEELLRQAELKAQKHHDAWLRAKAEAENIRKRGQIELANAHRYAIESFAAELLPVRDSLEATLAADSSAIDALKSGVELTLKQLVAVFDKANIREINPANEKFDPHRHQAISMLPSDKEPNTIINVLQKGYALHDRVIRPALVTVAKSRDA